MMLRKEHILYLFLTLLFLAGTQFARYESSTKINDEVVYHARAVSSYAWNLDYAGMEQYLTQALLSNNYSRISYYDNVSKSIELQLMGAPLKGFNLFMNKVHLMNEQELIQKVSRDEDDLGSVHIFYFNKRIYTYSYIFLIYVLILFILYLIIRLYRERSGLEIRVNKRTEELEQEVINRKRVQDDLRLTLDSIGDGVMILDTDRKIRGMNPVAEKLTGWPLAEALGKTFEEVYMSKFSHPLLDKILNTESVSRSDRDTILVSREGEEYRVSESGAPIRNSDGSVGGVVLVIRDITAEYRMQVQLEHSQRLDAIGQLAGGVAHDFNNILGGIMGFSELLEGYLNSEPRALEINKMIIDACGRAAELTNKLLTFSRKSKTSFTTIHLNSLLRETVVLLRSTLDRRIDISLQLHAEEDSISGDEPMLQNAVINLAINASHAMPQGGPLLIQTSSLVLDQHYCSTSAFDLEPGNYVDLRIEDKGTGIPREVLSRIFEPFFTTKEQGKGTGLGLAAVYGTVQQHDGEIKVYSEVGIGTSFNILLPLSTNENRADHSRETGDLRGHATILLADDEEIIRIPLVKMLELLGYTVLQAGNGREAVSLFEKEKDRIDLVILDMIMPEMNGRDCFVLLREIRQDIPVILASGFSETEDIRFLKSQGLNAFITKPFRQNQIARLIRNVLNNEAPPVL